MELKKFEINKIYKNSVKRNVIYSKKNFYNAFKSF